MKENKKMHSNETIQRKCPLGLKEILLLVGGSATAIAIAAQATPPALKISSSSPGYMLITVTNATPSDGFNIYYTPNLNPGYVWNFYAIGSIGQSNFTLPIMSIPSGFYMAAVGSDSDGDGVPDWKDSNPTNASIGLLTVIIDSPTNGYTFR